VELEGKVALVTGASSGIGRAIAERFAVEGAAVVVNHIGTPEEADQVVRAITGAGGRAIAVEADVSERDEVAAMVARATSEYGRIDVLVNDAGISIAEPFLDMQESTWDRMLHVDLKGGFLCAQACGRVMRDHGGGVIVNISSVHEDVPFPGFVHYCAAKGGLRMMMRALALDLAPYNIRVNNIAPGAIATPINERTLEDPQKMQLLRHVVPMGRMGKPDEVAQVALFLASDRAAYVTGSTYYVDGGLARHAESV
jgi:glucose 1-dehydrogenase